jgi:hypothetical protein
VLFYKSVNRTGSDNRNENPGTLMYCVNNG